MLPYLDVVQLVKVVAHAVRLRLKITQAVHVWSHQHGDAAEDLNAHCLKAFELEWVIGHQLDALKRGSPSGQWEGADNHGTKV